MAGKRKGKEDERHLWPEMLRAIKEIQPRWVVGENVYGLVNWSNGLVFHEVQADLEAAGYEVFPYVLPAVSVNAPHRRDRVWFVAYANIHGLGIAGKQPFDARKDFFGCGILPEGTTYDAPHPNRNGFNGSDCQHEVNASEGGEYAQRYFEQMGGDVADREGKSSRWELQQQQRQRESGGCDSKGDVADPDSGKRHERGMYQAKPETAERHISPRNARSYQRTTWQNFPTVPPIRLRDDGVSNKLLRFVVNEFYDTRSYSSEKNRIKNLQEVWEHIQSEEIWEQIRGLYSLESKNVLLQTMQLYSGEYKEQEFSSPFSEKLCEPIMQHLWKHKEFRCSPQGQELEKQRTEQFGNSLSFLPHEVALAARRFETAVAKFESWHRNESIKAAGNAIVPQVALQIFKTIQQYENLNN